MLSFLFIFYFGTEVKEDSNISVSGVFQSENPQRKKINLDLTSSASKKGRKKQGVRLKESEITSFISQVQEKSLTSPSFEKVHVSIVRFYFIFLLVKFVFVL